MERLSREAAEYRLFTTPASREIFEFLRRPPQPESPPPPELLPPPVKFYGFPDETRASYVNAGFLADFELALERLFARLFYLGPLRDHPQRDYPWTGAEPADVGKRGEKAVEALLAAEARGRAVAAPEGAHNVPLTEYIALKLKEMGLIHDFAIRPVSRRSDRYQVLVQQNATSPKVMLTDVGFGLSQVLPVLVLCYYVPEGSIILLEQPEIHLHPAVQAELADVLIDAVKTRKLQIVIESHSEHLLRRLQRRIAEEKYAKEDAALYFCEMRDGASHLTPLELDEYGNIRNWPNEFFGDDFGEMAAMTRAAMDRKMRQAS